MRPAPIWGALKELRATGRSSVSLLGEDRKQLSSAVACVVADMRRRSGSSASGTVPRDEMVQRLVYPVINEAAMCLQEGVARCADDVDLAMVFGTGFAPFRGGPLRYAMSIGLDKVVAGLERMAASHPHLAPSTALKEFARRGNFDSETASNSKASHKSAGVSGQTTLA